VTKGFAGIKFSVSPRINGLVSVSVVNSHLKMMKPTKSLVEKYGWKGTLSLLEVVPTGLLEPV
jgi:hypothetical protein